MTVQKKRSRHHILATEKEELPQVSEALAISLMLKEFAIAFA
ncbi:hypothetical protein [Dapis sp. BLCC M229]